MNQHHLRRWVPALVGLCWLLSACAPPARQGFVQAWSYTGKDLGGPFWWYKLVGVDGARDKGVTGYATKVAIVDTGVLKPHEDLPDAHILPGIEFCSGKKTTDTMDTNGHGTQLAGIVLGRDPADPAKTMSTKGVAPNASLLPFKVVCAVAKAVAVAGGVLTAIEAKPDIVLLALGGWPADTDGSGNDVHQLLSPLVSLSPNILFVVASVWDGATVKAPDWTTHANVLLVAGMTLDDKKMEVPFSEKRGAIWAPAQRVETASIEPDPKNPPNHAQFLMPGTSAAAAIVAGCAALVKERTGLTGAELKKALVDAAETQTSLPGGGRLNCSMAIPASPARR